MPYSAGPNIAARPNLVFEYDLGDVANSYKGEPTTNYWNGNQFSIYNDGATNIRNSTDVAPPVPGYEVVKVTANNIGSYGQCILWNATYPNNNVATITNSIYAYLTVGDYVQVGQHWWPWYYGTQKAIPKNQWVRISETYTINEGNSYGNAALTYSTNGIAYFAMPQFEYVSHVTPFIGANQTRSNTQGLLDISGRGNTVTLANMSYDANAQPFFDGTDDCINPGSFNLLSMGSSTLESIVYFNALSSPDSSYSIFGGISNEGYHGYHEVRNGGSGYKMTYWTSANGWQYANTAVSAGIWYHLVWVWEGTKLTWYLNGLSDGSYTFTTFSPYGLGISRLGCFPNERYMNGKINIARIYNRALPAQEVRRNYNQLKTRFNLP